MKQKYWIEIYTQENFWRWKIKSINGRVKAFCGAGYPKRSLCLNDAKAFADYAGLEVRE